MNAENGGIQREVLLATRAELRRLLDAAGLGPNQTRVWLDSRSALLSGLIPAQAITDQATADRARTATHRLIARLGPKAPDPGSIVAADLGNPG